LKKRPVTKRIVLKNYYTWKNVNFIASHCKALYALKVSFGTKKKGFPEDSINFVKLGERPSDNNNTSEWLIVDFILPRNQELLYKEQHLLEYHLTLFYWSLTSNVPSKDWL
jgi:hypothetical protein